MTFLYDDKILVKFLSEAGMLDKLIKDAQVVEANAKDIALKLAKNLLQSNTTIDGKDADLFVKDLVSLEAYLNYLLKNDRRTNDGMAIVLQGQGINGGPPPEANKQFYKPYGGFFVHVSGITNLINMLDVEAQKPGNEVMKPLVKNLKSAATKAFGADFTPQQLPDNPSKRPYNVSMMGDESIFDPDAKKNKGTETEVGARAKVTPNTISQTPPFGSDNLISPLDMYNFITNMDKLLLQSSNKLPEIAGLQTQFARLSNNILVNYNDWIGFINRMPPESSASNYHDHVPYNRSKPYSAFMSMFPGGNAGSPQGHAIEAGARLTKMIETTSYALELMQRSPQLMTIFKDFVPVQLQRAKTFMNGLQSFPGH